MIGRLLALAFLAGAALVCAVVGTHDPEDRVAVAGLLFGLGVMAFALASAIAYYLPPRRRRRAGVALRRGALVGLAFAAVAFLRALDALTVVTVAFVLAALAALEGVLSART